MRFSKLTKITSVLMIALLPAANLAAETSGLMLYPQGAVTVNGTAVTHSQAGFDGDRYQTSKDSSLVMSGLGSSIQVAPASDVSFRGSALHLNSGGAAITTQRGMTSQVFGLTVKPVGAQARYSVAANESQIVIGAEEGSVIVSDGTIERIVPQGKALVANLEPLPAVQNQDQSQGQQNDDKNKKDKRKGGAVPAAQSSGPVLSKAALITIGAIAAGAGIAIAILLANHRPSSPVH